MKIKKCTVIESFLGARAVALQRLDESLTEIEQARSNCWCKGDNTPDCTCGQEIKKLEAEIADTESCLLTFCRIGKNDLVGPGSLVVLRASDGKIVPFIIVDKRPCRNSCSVLSVSCVPSDAPIVKVLLGKQKGDTAECRGDIYRILSVQ